MHVYVYIPKNICNPNGYFFNEINHLVDICYLSQKVSKNDPIFCEQNQRFGLNTQTANHYSEVGRRRDWVLHSL